MAQAEKTAARGEPAFSERTCMRCGYSLRGLPDEGSCPECGTAVAWSLRGDLLRYAAPEYVGRLAAGARLVWWSVAIALIAGVLVMPVVLLTGSILIMPVLMLVVCTMYLGGWWLLSSPDPARAERRSGGARMVLRVSMLVAIGTFMTGSVLVMVPGPGSRALDLPLGLAGVAAAMASFVASLQYLRGLAPRLPDAKLRKRAGALMWVLAVLAAGVVIMTIADTALSVTSAAPRMPIGCALLMVDLVFIVMYAGMLDRVKAQLNAVLKEIRTAAPGVPG